VGVAVGPERLQELIQQEKGEDVHREACQYVLGKRHLFDAAFRGPGPQEWRAVCGTAIHGQTLPNRRFEV